MSVPSSATELEEFREFVDQQMAVGACATVDELVDKFRRCQRELQQLRSQIEPALQQSQRGESSPLDVGALKARVAKRLADEGITD